MNFRIWWEMYKEDIFYGTATVAGFIFAVYFVVIKPNPHVAIPLIILGALALPISAFLNKKKK